MDHEHLRPDSPLMTMSNSFLRDGMLQLSIPGPGRDPVYYISDGNSVLLVENTLFKVRICSTALQSVCHNHARRAHSYQW